MEDRNLSACPLADSATTPRGGRRGFSCTAEDEHTAEPHRFTKHACEPPTNLPDVGIFRDPYVGTAAAAPAAPAPAAPARRGEGRGARSARVDTTNRAAKPRSPTHAAAGRVPCQRARRRSTTPIFPGRMRLLSCRSLCALSEAVPEAPGEGPPLGEPTPARGPRIHHPALGLPTAASSRGRAFWPARRARRAPRCDPPRRLERARARWRPCAGRTAQRGCNAGGGRGQRGPRPQRMGARARGRRRRPAAGLRVAGGG